MNFRLVYIILLSLIIVGCAQVPKESIELSTTIGRDLATVHKAHRKLAQILFAHMRGDINRFVEEVYTPYQIQYMMSEDKKLATSSKPEDQKRSLLLAIKAAFESDAPPQSPDKALEGMSIVVRRLREKVESVRQEMLSYLDAQEAEVLDSIDRSYQQLHYANSIVTGHLSSVRKVHETQARLLDAMGVDRDLRKEVGENLSKASDKIADLVKAAEKTDANLAETKETVQKIKDEISKITKPITDNQKEK